MNYPALQRPLLLGLLLSVLFLTSWEYYCREHGFVPAPEDDKHLWAEHRGRVEDNKPNQVLILGASRAHFDFQLDVWEEVTGNRPIMLAGDGKAPGPVLRDVVENTKFNGTIVLNVTEGLFFVPSADSSGGWGRANEWVKFYHSRTYAQRFNHFLSGFIQPHFALLTVEQEGGPDLKALVERLPPTGRLNNNYPPFPQFAYVDADRNTTMFDRIVTDTSFANTIRRVWTFGDTTVNWYEPIKPKIFEFYADLFDTFKARGGKIILTRNPSHGLVKANEDIIHPRAQYWDKLVKESGWPAYHFEDYPELNKFFTPEWSHLSTPDAREYTRSILAIMKRDNALK